MQSYIDVSNSFKTNTTISQSHVLICNEEDYELVVFNRETFGGSKRKTVWDKTFIMRCELDYLLNKNTNHIQQKSNNSMNINENKNLFIDLNLSKIKQNNKNNELLQPIRQSSHQSEKSDEKKSPQFQIKCILY